MPWQAQLPLGALMVMALRALNEPQLWATQQVAWGCAHGTGAAPGIGWRGAATWRGVPSSAQYHTIPYHAMPCHAGAV